MFDVIGKYQASLFVKATDIIPSPEVISTLLDMFRDRGFLPSTFQELGPRSPAPQIRLRLSSPNNEWSINFPSNRIDIEKHPVTAKGKNVGDIEAFVEDAQNFFTRILAKFKKKGNRMAILTSGMMRDMTKEQLATVYLKLFRPIQFYQDNAPFEWNSRTVCKSNLDIEGVPEPINAITNINRVNGELIETAQVMRFDRIEINFDFNTVPENEDYRFNEVSFTDFSNGALHLRSNIIEQIRGIING